LPFLAPRARCWLLVTLSSPSTPSPSPQSCSPAAQPHPVLVPGVVPPQGQDPALALVEPHQVPLCPALQPVQGSLDGRDAHGCSPEHALQLPASCSPLGRAQLVSAAGVDGDGPVHAAGKALLQQELGDVPVLQRRGEGMRSAMGDTDSAFTPALLWRPGLPPSLLCCEGGVHLPCSAPLMSQVPRDPWLQHPVPPGLPETTPAMPTGLRSPHGLLRWTMLSHTHQ